MSIKFRRGDTLIEVAIALAVFSLVVAITLATMNKSAEMMQGTLELSMTRNEIDAQAEALRYIQNAYLSERELETTAGASGGWRVYKKIWDELTKIDNGLANNPTKISDISAATCSVYYENNNKSDQNHSLFEDKGFILNTRNLDPNKPDSTIISAKNNKNKFSETPTYPRVIFSANSGAGSTEDTLNEIPEGVDPQFAPVYNVVNRVEGIWVIATRDVSTFSDPKNTADATIANTPAEFFDFYIRGCWYAPGNNYPSTISTIIRLYNPEYIRKG